MRFSHGRSIRSRSAGYPADTGSISILPVRRRGLPDRNKYFIPSPKSGTITAAVVEGIRGTRNVENRSGKSECRIGSCFGWCALHFHSSIVQLRLISVTPALKEGVVRIVRTFGNKLLAFKFPPKTAAKLQGFVDYS
jgi:hypothetical protein